MPTLLQKVQQGSTRRDASGQLTQETPEELQSLSGKMGLQAAPITPLGAQTLGANPDQAKMAGTPAQKNASLAASVQPSNSLQDTLRRNEGNQNQTATAGQAASQQKSQELQNLGGIGDRVAGFIEKQRQNLAAATQAAQTPEVQAAQTFNGKDVSQIKPLLAQLRANPTDQNLMLQVNQALGYDTKTQLDPSQIDQLYESSVDAIARAGAGNVDNDLTVDDLTGMKDFGYDKPELANLLGLPEDQVGQMSVANIRDRISQIQSDEYSNSQKLEQQASSGQLGAAERALAREGARGSSRVGERSSEADVSNLENQIAKGDQVQFGGNTYSVEDLLKDDTISGIISDYLNSAPGSPERAQLEKTEPQLTGFIQKNQNILDEASKSLQSGAATFQDTQSYNQNVAAQLPPNLAQLVAPEAGALSASKIDVDSKPLLKYIQSNPAVTQYLQGIDDRDAQAVASLDKDQLSQLFDNNGEQWQMYQQAKAQIDTQMAQARQARNPQQIAELVSGGTVSDLGAIQQSYSQQKNSKLLGFGTSGDYSQLDTDGDGNIDSPESLLQNYKDRVGSYSIQDSLAGKDPGKGALSVPAPSKLSEDQQGIYDKLNPALADGKVDANELANSGLSSDQMLSLDFRAPGFSGTNISSTLAKKASSEILSKYNVQDPAQAAQAYAELTAKRGTLADAVSQKGGQGSDVVAAMSTDLTNLSNILNKGKADTENAAKADKLAKWNSLYGNYKQDRFGRWYEEVNGIAQYRNTPPERPS